MRKVALLVAGLFLSAPAFGQSVGEKTGMNSLVGASPAAQDFVTEAAQSDMFEIQSSQLALKQAPAGDKIFAQQMITDHGKTTAELKSILQSNGDITATVPATMSKSQQSMLDALGSLHGDQFSRKYRSGQISVHKTAVSLFQRYGNGGDNAALKSWATKTLPTLQQHLQMAQKLPK